MDTIRIWRSPYSHFGEMQAVPDGLQDETVTAFDVYADDELNRIAQNGFNAIWIHGILQNIVSSEIFPEFGQNSAIQLRNMRRLINKAAKYEIKVFLYMQPPRAININNQFWERHPEVGGQETDLINNAGAPMRMRSLCTSTQKVKNYIYQSSAKLAEELPELGGIILITNSEYPSHCYGRCGTLANEFGVLKTTSVDCLSCAKRSPAEVISEIICLVRDGIKSVAENQEIIAWNWAWKAHYKSPCREIIEKLPKDVIVMTGFEQGGKKNILGKERVIDEYSLSFTGPSKHFIRTLDAVNDNGLRMMTKLQIGTTHELATVPSLPLIGNLYDKVKAMSDRGVFNFLGCWNFGNMFSANTAGFNFFLSAKSLKDKEQSLTAFALDYFQACVPKYVVQAWNIFGHAMDYYPFSVSFLYGGPLNYTLAYPLSPSLIGNSSAGRSWIMDERGDNLDTSLSEFSIDEVIKGLELVTRQWQEGVVLLEAGLKASKCNHSREELNNARVCYHIFRSGWNTYRAYRLRRGWSDSKMSEYLSIIKDELSNLKQVLPIVENDRRFGFHSEAQDYMFDGVSIRKKMNAL